MTLTQLNYFVTIVQERGFTKAAEKLFVNQSTLSKSVQALESEFEVELINRAAKDFKLTSEGQLFYEYAQHIQQYYQEQTQELYKRLHSGRSSLNLGLARTAGTIYFFAQIHRFRELWPDVELKITDELTSKEIKERMDAGEMDLGVMIEPFSDERYHSKRVYTSESVLAVSKKHPLAKVTSIQAAELQKEDFLLISPNFMYHDIVLDYCHKAGLEPKITFVSSQWDMLLEMVADGQGVSILPKPLIDKCYNTRVHEVHLKNPAFPWTLTLIYRKGKFVTAPMKHFLDLCSPEK